MLNISRYRNTTLLILQSYSGIRRRGRRKLVSGLVKLEVQIRLHAANYTKRLFAVGLAFLMSQGSINQAGLSNTFASPIPRMS
ncbi:MAG: hypothetical protein ACI8R8_002946 [Paraglaciecola sp.]|jgi:hypothetical protein